MSQERTLHINPDQVRLSASLVARLPVDIARRYHAIPLSEAGGEVTVVVSNAADSEVIQAITGILGSSTCLVEADQALIDQMIEKVYLPDGGLRESLLLWCPDARSARELSLYTRRIARVLSAQWEQLVIPTHDRNLQPTISGQVESNHASLLVYPINQPAGGGPRTFSDPQEWMLDDIPISQLIAISPRWPVKNLLLVIRNEICDDYAIQWAMRIARPVGARVTVLPMTRHISGVYRFDAFLEPNLVNLLNPGTELGHKLRHISKHLVESGIESTLKFREEPAYWQIRLEVNEGEYDMLIIGREPRNPYMRGLVGELIKPLLGWIDRPILITKNYPA